mmetsp:Transcript_15662/g.21203  ORF Transcript_15662/g.21203 Transcript_15662/m.21203 type:complete len:272 (-) Transcript_15662:1036-1851(-)
MPLARRLARQCLIGLDYMHRMCKIIHTDFKPENVVICLKDSEVAEIAKTGQLTTTKMFQQSDAIKKLNMKIAGTLQTPKELSLKQQSQSSTSLFASEYCTEGMTAKQKKNLRKKLYRKRKKMEQSQNNSKLDFSTQSIEDGEESKRTDSENADGEDNAAEPDLDIDIDDVAIGVGSTDKTAASKAAPDAQGKASTKKKAVTDSVERLEPELVDAKLNGELSGEKEAADSANQEDGGKQENKRGPKIGDDVQVKICDMGNGCWTYHHFTPEI